MKSSMSSDLSESNYVIVHSDKSNKNYIIFTSETPDYRHVPSINVTFSKPTAGYYLDLNKSEDIHKQLTKYFYYKFLDKWLNEDFNKLYSYLQVKNNKVIITDKNVNFNFNKEKLNEEHLSMKKDFIENELLRKKQVYNILIKFMNEFNLKWLDLTKHEHFVKRFIYDEILKIIKNSQR